MTNFNYAVFKNSVMYSAPFVEHDTAYKTASSFRDLERMEGAGERNYYEVRPVPMTDDGKVDILSLQISDLLVRGNDVREWPEDERDFYRNDDDSLSNTEREYRLAAFRAQKVIALVQSHLEMS